MGVRELTGFDCPHCGKPVRRRRWWDHFNNVRCQNFSCGAQLEVHGRNGLIETIFGDVRKIKKEKKENA